MSKLGDDISETPFGLIVDSIKKYNQENPKNEQPITNEILSMLNELRRIEQDIALKEKGRPLDYRKYNEDFLRLYEPLHLKQSYIKGLTVNFGHSVVEVKSKLLHAQIQGLLKKHLKNNWPSNEKKRKPGQPESRWHRVVIQGKPIIEKLYAAGITADFLAIFFKKTLETFKRKARR